MSTHRPPEDEPPDAVEVSGLTDRPEVAWFLLYQDGASEDNLDGKRWHDISHCELVDGLPLSLTEQPVQHLTLMHSIFGELSIRPPEPLPFFAFARYAQAVGGGTAAHPTWLYSAFGYVLPDYVYAVKMRADLYPECLLLPRPMTFPL